jgi:hypothetical protein
MWDCPAAWVAHARGGCAPAVLICGTDAAASGACDGIDLAAAPSEGAPFVVLPDGGIGGPWPEPGGGDGPAETFLPEQGTGTGYADWAPDAEPAALRRRVDDRCDRRV